MEKKTVFIAIVITLMSSCKETPLQRPDNDFDVSVNTPGFTSFHPPVLFDEGHNNFHTTTGLYQPFAKLIRNDGYNLNVLGNKVTDHSLNDINIFIIANAKGKGDANDSPAFTKQECVIIKNWVNNGGSLLLIADHFPFGSAVQCLGDEFGINFQKGMVEDSLNYDKSSKDYSQLEFSKQTGLLREHEVTQGINKVITFTGESIKCRDSCFSFLNLAPSAFDLQPKIKITKDGNDTRVQVNYDSPTSANGRSQGIAITFGKGKIVVLGEAAMLTAQKCGDNSNVGMNYNPDNKVLALNIMHWLTKKE
jgi:hypothetical protein